MKFAKIYEPSGILQLADGRLLLIEDEKARPFSLCRLEDRDGQLAIGQPIPYDYSGAADDLEGLAGGPDGWIFAITSHTPAGGGGADQDREKLLRFKVGPAGRLEHYQEYGGLLPALLSALKAVDPMVSTINIEGLCFDHDRGKLLIGLREPVVAGKSLLLTLENPEGLFVRGESPRIAREVIRLDLQGGGIRAMAYIPALDGYLLANETVGEAGKPRARLWLWDGIAGHEAHRLRFPGSGKVKNIEGVGQVLAQDRALLLLVCDDGNRQKDEGAHYRFLEFGQLIEDEAGGESRGEG
jgi:hypothetical protein